MVYEHYYYNNSLDDNGNHEIHTRDCKYVKPLENRTYIGYKRNCEEAVKQAKRDSGKRNFDGCFWCAKNCHHG